jgi:hypothetical protein
MITTANVAARLDPHVRGLLREVEAIWDEVVDGATPAPSVTAPDAPQLHTWVELNELHNQTDTWPKKGGGKDVAVFERFRVFERDDGLKIGLGYRRRDDGKVDVGVFRVEGSDKKHLIVYFQATDDSSSSGKTFAPIRGKGGGRSYFRGSEAIPPDYAGKEVVTMSDVAPKHRLREIKVVLAAADDWLTMAEHGAAQVRIRNLGA